MKVAQQLLLLGALFVSAGCSTLPRGEPVPTDMADQVVERYKNRLPPHFEVMHAVVITIKPHWWWPAISQVTIGCSTVDRATRSYEVTCFSPLGMKLFNISRTNDLISGTLLLPGTDRHELMVQAIGTAISRAYLDMSPGPGATAVRQDGVMIMTRFSGNHRTDYTFSGTNAVLSSKEYFDGRKRIMTVSYSDYRTETNGLFPGRMSLKDHRNGYNLLFLLKEFKAL